MQFKLNSARETKALGARLAKALMVLKPLPKEGRVIGFSGELGTGKTTFIQGFIRELNPRARVASPTFLIVRSHNVSKQSAYTRVYHSDLYRISKRHELAGVGMDEILSDPQNIILIEWVERASALLPKSAIRISLTHGKKEKEREITIEAKSKNIINHLKKHV